jgi:uncharacterized repeat protein (TIGR02543 family)
MRIRQRGVRAGLIMGQFALCAALLGGPCGGKDAPTGPALIAPSAADDVVVTVTSYNPRVGETAYIGAERVTRQKQRLNPIVPCTFAGSSNVFASVGLTTGVITALAPGTLVVTVTCGDKNTTVTLTIRPQLVTLTVTMLGAGTGSVFVSPAQSPYDAGTTVTLTARPLSVQPGASVFTGWGGACAAAGANTECVIVLAANTNVTATFVPAFVLRLLTTGTGTGGIAATPSQQTYAAGTPVQLAATAYDGSGFAAWTGDCAGTVSPCNIVMNADRTVTAQFEKLTKLSTDFWGAFERITNYDGCAWDPELAGSLAASYFVRGDGTVGGTATATVNITYTSPTGCAATPSSFTNAANIQGTAAALTWTNIGAQAFSLVFNGTLTNPNRIDGGAVATRTFQGSGPSGTKVTVARAQLPGMYLTP